MKEIKINANNKNVYEKNIGHNAFNQLAVKIDMNSISDREYFDWLDMMILEVPKQILGVTFLEREGVRDNPPLNTAVYYDTSDYKILPTNALLRTSCSMRTHAFCAFKSAEDSYGNRMDRRHVFQGEQKKIIQEAPYSKEAISIVQSLLARTDLDHPGVFLKKELGISGVELSPAMVLLGHRSTFFVRLDDMDILRCSIDRSKVFDFRKDPDGHYKKEFREVEFSIYPHIPSKIVEDPRVVNIINYFVDSITNTLKCNIIYDIKYQRGSFLLNILQH